VGDYGADWAMGVFSNGDYVALCEYVQSFAQAGDPDAQCMMGTLFQLGKGFSPDLEEAVRWYKLAANQGHSVAWNNLGTIYLMGGEGVPQDPEEAKRCYERAYRLGFVHIPREYAPIADDDE
jgi:TPR repeat protein